MSTLQTVFNRMAIELGRSKDIIAIAADRDSAIAAQIDIRNAITDRDHIETGKLYDSISVSKYGSEYAIKAIYYGKYVNGYGRESDGTGFIDDGVNASILDGYEVEVVV